MSKARSRLRSKDAYLTLNDWCHVNVCDKEGLYVSNADNTVKISIENGRLIGCENGNPSDPIPGICYEVKAFHGKCQFIVEGS